MISGNSRGRSNSLKGFMYLCQPWIQKPLGCLALATYRSNMIQASWLPKRISLLWSVYRFFQLWQEILGLRSGSQCISKLRSRSHCISTKVQCENSSVDLPHFLNESRMFNLYGGFLSHGGTPSHHPFLDGILPL